jgi:hypothetical protein
MIRRVLVFSMFFLFFKGIAYAVPDLQNYSPDSGVYYDNGTQTWIIPYTDYTLWVVSANHPINDVKIAFAVPTNENGSITINGTKLTESLLISYSDYISTGYSGTNSVFVADGTPFMGDGSTVPLGGIFPSSFYQYYLRDFPLTTTVHNYTPGSYSDTATGYIESLSISVEGYSEASIISYDHYCKSKGDFKYVKTPYSHDGQSASSVPEPATMLLFGTALAWLVTIRIKKTV